MSFKFTIFQLEITGAPADISKVAGTERVYSGGSPSGNDINVITVSDIEESLELEEGVYKLGNVSLTVDGLAADYFNGYNDEVFFPYVGVIEDESTSEVLFHGVIDPESITYNARTKFTAFEVLSWDFLLKRFNVAAREIYQTEFTRDWKAGYDVDFYINRFENGLNPVDLSTVIGVGDVLVYNSDAGEHRSLVYQVSLEGSNELKLKITHPPVEAIATSVAYTDGETFLQSGIGWVYRIKITDPNVIHALLDIQDKLFVNVDQDGSGIDFRNWVKQDAQLDRASIEGTYLESAKGGAIFMVFPIAGISGWQDSATGTIDIYASRVVEVGNRVKILSNEVYGVNSPAFIHPYVPEDIVEGLFSLSIFGVLQYVVSSVTLPNDSKDIHQFAEFPEDPYESLKLIQNTIGSFIKYVPSLDGNNLPRLSIEGIPRSNVNTSSRSTIAASNVREWNEQSADLTPTAIIATTNVDYFRPKTYLNDVIGFYYNGINSLSATDRKLKGRPEGPRVIEIDTLARPAYNIDNSNVFSGEGEPLVNDRTLKKIAKFYWEYYENLKRPSSAIIAERRTDLLGNFVTLSEVDLPPEGGRTMFVDRVRISLSERTTYADGRIGEYTPVETGTPFARITGPFVFINNSIRLSALDSYDPLGRRLSYEWFIDDISTSTSYRLISAQPTGSYLIGLEVTAGGTTSLREERTVIVVDDISDPDNPFDILQLFRFEQDQINDGGIQKGQLRIYPRTGVDQFVNTIRYRKITGENFAPVDKSTGSPSVWYPVTTTTDTDDNGDFFYDARVELAERRQSHIEIYVEFLSSLNLDPITDVFSFDGDKIPSVAMALSLAGDEAYLSYEGDEDTASITYATSTSAMPSDAAADGGTVNNGREADEILVGTLTEGQTLYLKAVGWSGANGTGNKSATYFTASVTFPTDTVGVTMIPPTMFAGYTQTGGTGNYTLTLVDPDARSTQLIVWEKEGTTSESQVYNDATPPITGTAGSVTIGTKHGSIVRWRLSWQDDDLNTHYLTGSHTFDIDLLPEYEQHTLTVEDNGNVLFRVEGDEDVQSLRIIWEANDPTPDLNTINHNDVSYPSGSGLASLTTLSEGDTIYIDVIFYDGPTQTGNSTTKSFAASYRTDTVGWTDPSDIPDGGVLEVKLKESARRFVQVSGNFFTDNATHLKWTSGFTIRLKDEGSNRIEQNVTDSIFLGSAGTSDFLYIYWDLVDDIIKGTTTFTISIEDDHLLLAVAKPAPATDQEAFYVPAIGMSGSALKINADHISANTITTQMLQANSVTAVKINVVNLEAISASMGNLDVDGTLSIAGGELLSNTASDGWVIDGTSIRGVDGGIVQIEIRSSDGKLIAGSGDEVVLDEDGIRIIAPSGRGSIGSGPDAASIDIVDADGTTILASISKETGDTAHAGTDLTLESSGFVEIISSAGGNIYLHDGEVSPFGSIFLQATEIWIEGNNAGLFLEKSVAATVPSTHGRLWVDSAGDLFWRPPNTTTDIKLN